MVISQGNQKPKEEKGGASTSGRALRLPSSLVVAIANRAVIRGPVAGALGSSPCFFDLRYSLSVATWPSSLKFAKQLEKGASP